MKDDIDNIGTRIKERRKQKALTIQEMALYTGLSTGYLSNIERNQTSPTLNNLRAICNALGVSITDMLQAKEEERVIVRKKDMVIREYPELNQTVRLIYFGGEGDVYEYITIAPGKPESALDSKHPYDEVATVLQGTMVVEAEGEKYVLTKGDSICIKARHKHRIYNGSDKKCESFWHYKKREK